MTMYAVIYSDGASGYPSRHTASTLRSAEQFARKIVREGFRNESWARIHQGDDDIDAALTVFENRHGRAVRRS